MWGREMFGGWLDRLLIDSEGVQSYTRVEASDAPAQGPSVGSGRCGEAIRDDGEGALTMSMASLWTRLGNWLRNSQWSEEETAGAGKASAPAERAVEVVHGEVADDGEEPGRHALAHFGRLSRRDEMLQKLQEGSEKVLALVGSIQRHMEETAQHEARTVESLGRMMELLGDLPSMSRQQIEQLGAMAQEVSTQRRQAEEMAGALTELSDLPELARAQAASLREVSGRVEQGLEQDEALASRVAGLGETLSGLSAATAAAARRLDGVDQALETRQRLVRDELRVQGTRLTKLLVATLVVSGLGLLGAVAAIVMQIVSRSS